MKALTGSGSEIKKISFEEACSANFEDMQRRMPDIGKIGELIGYEPRIELDEMLERIIEHLGE